MKKGVLLVNLGSPDSPEPHNVKKYLREFLMDGRVLDAPYPIRFGVVHGCILPFRPKQSAEAYEKIWLPEGSPLVVTSLRVRDTLQERVSVPVEVAMRYQNPAIENALQNLIHHGDELLLIPLFPHYAMSSYETAVARVRELLRKMAPQIFLTVVPPYYNHPGYIGALVASAEEYLAQDFDHLLFSFHGVPERHLLKSDPTKCHCLKVKNCCESPSPAHATCYRAQCFQTMKAFAAAAGIPSGKYSVAFQSRLGRDPWLQPYTDVKLKELAESGAKRLLVICPAFVSDCLETIEEIGLRGRETFLAAGGKDFQMISCLNEHPRWIQLLENLVGEFTAGHPLKMSAEAAAV
ncbi:MAG TPA: ferrochelatase [Verrucomicrobiae bacterium]|nr:ferrochelatase [Verrucomicrobiae bacterium]